MLKGVYDVARVTLASNQSFERAGTESLLHISMLATFAHYFSVCSCITRICTGSFISCGVAVMLLSVIVAGLLASSRSGDAVFIGGDIQWPDETGPSASLVFAHDLKESITLRFDMLTNTDDGEEVFIAGCDVDMTSCRPASTPVTLSLKYDSSESLSSLASPSGRKIDPGVTVSVFVLSST